MKTTKIKITFVGLVLIAMVLLTYLFANSKWCHSNPVLFVQASSGVFDQLEENVYMLVNPHHYRPATGICAFPDGGTPLTLSNQIDLYKFDLEEKSSTRVDFISEDQLSNFIISSGSNVLHFTHKDSSYAYAVLGGQDESSLRLDQRYIEVDLQSSSMRILDSKEEYQQLTSASSKINGSYDFSDMNQYVVLEYGDE
ncbi:MAG: hypothetical protein ACPGO5_05450, partial [Patescibacteria group bacterium]